MKEHIDRVHSEKKFPCEVCKIEFQSDQDIKIHKEKIHDKSAVVICHICQTKLNSYREISVHIEEDHEEVKVHQESNKQNEANIVIKSITKKFKQIQTGEEKETENVILKRAKSVSPIGIRSKSSKIDLTYKPDIEEDLKLVEQVVIDLRAENLELKKKVQDVEFIKSENEQLRKQLKDQEEDTVRAMKAIENQIEV